MDADKLLENLRYGVNYEGQSGFCDSKEGYTTISGVKIIDVDRVIPEIMKSIPKNKSVWFHYAIDRLCAIHKLWDKGQYYVEVVEGYYGQEIGGVLLDEKTRKAFEEDLKKINESENNDKLVFRLLEAEYGHILPCLKNASFSIKKVDLLTISFGSVEYYRKVYKEALNHYTDRTLSLPQAIVLKVGKNKYRLIDGYHRLAVLVGQGEPVSVIVAAQGKG